MRPVPQQMPQPMDGTGAHRVGPALDDTQTFAPIPPAGAGYGSNNTRTVRLDNHDHFVGAIDPDPSEPNKAAAAHHPRHQAAKDDLPGPTRRELARLVRQVRTIGLVLVGGMVAQVGYAFWYHVIR